MTQCPKCSSRRLISRTNHLLQNRGTLAVLEDIEVEACPTCRDVRVNIPEMERLISQMEPFKTSKVWPTRFRFADGDWKALTSLPDRVLLISDAVAAFIDQSVGAGDLV